MAYVTRICFMKILWAKLQNEISSKNVYDASGHLPVRTTHPEAPPLCLKFCVRLEEKHGKDRLVLALEDFFISGGR